MIFSSKSAAILSLSLHCPIPALPAYIFHKIKEGTNLIITLKPILDWLPQLHSGDERDGHF